MAGKAVAVTLARFRDDQAEVQQVGYLCAQSAISTAEVLDIAACQRLDFRPPKA
jgi:hypothetical protein